MRSALIVLDTFVDPSRKRAPVIYPINPQNFSGRRLYGWLGGFNFWVCNVCPQSVPHPTKYGTPDDRWLLSCLDFYVSRKPEPELLLVCGNRPQKCLLPLTDTKQVQAFRRLVFMPHPAARTWSKALLEQAGRIVQSDANKVHLKIDNRKLKNASTWK